MPLECCKGIQKTYDSHHRHQSKNHVEPPLALLRETPRAMAEASNDADFLCTVTVGAVCCLIHFPIWLICIVV